MPGPSVVGELALRVRAEMSQFRADMEAEAKRSSQSFGTTFQKNLSQHATAAAAFTGAAVGRTMYAATEAFVAFDDKMREIFSIMPGITKQAMDQMSGDIRRIAVETGQSAEQVAEGVYDAISSGIDPKSVTGFIETATKAAVAGVSNTKDAAAVLASTLNSYSLSADHAEEVADTLFQTVKVGVTTFPELAAEMAQVSPVASVMGVDLTQTTAALAAMTLQGHDTASAATDIAAVFTLLQKGTPGLNKVLKEMGYESGQAALDALGFQGTLEMLREGADRLGIAIPTMTGRVQAAQAIFALTGDKAEASRKVLDSYGESTGAVTEAFETMESGVGGAVRHIQSQVHDALIGLGDVLEPVAPIFMAFGPQIGRWIGMGVGAIAGVLGKYLAGPAIRGAVAAAGAVAGKAYGLAVTVAAKASMLAGDLLSAVTGSSIWQRAGALAGGRFGTAFKIGAIAAVALLWVEVWNQFQQFQAQVEKAQADLQKSVDAAAEQAGTEAIGNLQKLTTQLKSFQGLDRVLADTFGGAQEVEGLRNLARAIEQDSNLTADQIAAAITTITDAAAEAAARGNVDVQTELLKIAEGLKSRTPAIVDAVEGQGEGVAEAVTDSGDQVLTALQMADRFSAGFRAWQDHIKAGFAGAAEEVRVGFGSIKNALANPPQLISPKDRLENMEGRMRKVMRNLRRAVKEEDPAGIDYWTNAAVTQQQRMDKIKTRTKTSVDDIRAAFERAGVKIDGTWLDIQRGAETTKGKVDTTGAAIEALPTRHTTTISVQTGNAMDRIDAVRTGLGAIPSVVRSTIQTVIQTVRDNANAPRPGGWDGNPATPWPRQFGGPVTAGVPYLVGEKRAEIFVPNVNGQIEPDARRAVAGPTINLQVHGLPMQARTPTEVAMQAARAARLGYFDTPRRSLAFEGIRG